MPFIAVHSVLVASVEKPLHLCAVEHLFIMLFEIRGNKGEVIIVTSLFCEYIYPVRVTDSLRVYG